ncbi:glycosyltransferase [Mucilaginibacter sp. HC2]|uniref:glycosyltransferase family 2 protein n=1 Tax=Mucilaginibacter inviolabilis TaxID=2714892 RepID=UPI00140C5500|nr:glycosyltransferase [Mucilaginibacter inviolabilis]NHA05909.1 glycosyltransferase [Mucilaginibacter inviolabilis]
MNNNISILVGLKNNLDYSKYFYQTTRSLYPTVEIVFVSYNSTDGTNEWLDSLQDDHIKYYYSPQSKTLAHTYNKCTELATKDYVVFAHNDMVLTPGFIEGLQKHLSQKSLLYYTTVEPPIFADDHRPWKIVKDFGTDIASFKKDDLYSFTNKILKDNTEPKRDVQGASFFLCVNRDALLKVGGLDTLFNPMFCEDDDLILRLSLLNLKKIVIPDVLCYHFISKTSRFSAEYQNKTQQIELNSNRNFVRKWGFKSSSSVKKKYDIGLIIKNCDEKLLFQLEPWCSTIYTDCDPEPYIAREQFNTAIDLAERIKPIESSKQNGVLISIDGKNFNELAYNKIQQLSEFITWRINTPLSLLQKMLLKNSAVFKWKMFKFEFIDTQTYEHQLIHIKITCDAFQPV